MKNRRLAAITVLLGIMFPFLSSAQTDADKIPYCGQFVSNDPEFGKIVLEITPERSTAECSSEVYDLSIDWETISKGYIEVGLPDEIVMYVYLIIKKGSTKVEPEVYYGKAIEPPATFYKTREYVPGSVKK